MNLTSFWDDQIEVHRQEQRDREEQDLLDKERDDWYEDPTRRGELYQDST